MAALIVAQHAPVTRRIEQVSGIRPITLLIASGIALITAILIATGIASNQLRQQALHTTESELGRIDSVIAETIGRSFNFVDAELADIADHVSHAGFADAASFLETATGRHKIGGFPSLSAV